MTDIDGTYAEPQLLYEVVYTHKTFHGTKEEFDQLVSNGQYYCPNCGFADTEPYPNCNCPTEITRTGYEFVRHINRWHHNCDHAMFKKRR